VQISLSNRQRHLRINRAALLEFLLAALEVAADVRRRITGDSFHDLSVALVDDDAIAAINRQFLNHTGPTDVISFDLGGGGGEIILSTERAVIVAKQLRRKPAHELALYLVHGLLHLAGMDDATTAQRRAMRAAERRVLHRLRPYALRITYYASPPVTRRSPLPTSPCP
jgi:probable rRNA maturation factor